jgi:hypothetical protein
MATSDTPSSDDVAQNARLLPDAKISQYCVQLTAKTLSGIATWYILPLDDKNSRICSYLKTLITTMRRGFGVTIQANV